MGRVVHLKLSLQARLWDLCIFLSAKTHLAAVIGELDFLFYGRDNESTGEMQGYCCGISNITLSRLKIWGQENIL